MSAPAAFAQNLLRTPHLAGEPLQILLIADDPEDAESCIRALRQDGLAVTADVMRTQEEFRALLSEKTLT